MTDSNNAKTMYETIPAAAELNKVPGFDPLKFLRRAGNSMKLDLPYQKLWFRMAHPNGRMRAVSYTHLDVYKRQAMSSGRGRKQPLLGV